MVASIGSGLFREFDNYYSGTPLARPQWGCHNSGVNVVSMTMNLIVWVYIEDYTSFCFLTGRKEKTYMVSNS